MRYKLLLICLIVGMLLLTGCGRTNISDDNVKDFCEDRGMKYRSNHQDGRGFDCHISDIEYTRIIVMEEIENEIRWFYKTVPRDGSKS